MSKTEEIQARLDAFIDAGKKNEKEYEGADDREIKSAFRRNAPTDIDFLLGKVVHFRMALASIREIYCNTEGFKSETAPEAYLQHVAKDMYTEAVEALQDKNKC